MWSRAALAVALLVSCGWATTLAQPSPPANAPGPRALDTTQRAEVSATIPGAAHFGPDSSRLAAQALKLASADDGDRPSMPISVGPSNIDNPAHVPQIDGPQGWALMAAGIWLIVGVSRRRKRSAVFQA